MAVTSVMAIFIAFSITGQLSFWRLISTGLDAILLNSRIDRTDSFSNDEKAKKSFRIICPEK